MDASQRARALRLAQALKNRQGCEDDAADLLYELLAEPERVPLTNDEIYAMYSEPRSDAEMVEFARAVERAHGIVGGGK